MKFMLFGAKRKMLLAVLQLAKKLGRPVRYWLTGAEVNFTAVE